MNDDYRNIYLESRYIKHYNLVGDLSSSFLAGIRFYHGDTHRIQGSNTGSDANFTVDDPNNLQIDCKFPSYMHVDPNLKDVKGYNFDIGYRGQFLNLFSLDVSKYYLLYKNRIGVSQQSDGGDNVYIWN